MKPAAAKAVSTKASAVMASKKAASGVLTRRASANAQALKDITNLQESIISELADEDLEEAKRIRIKDMPKPLWDDLDLDDKYDPIMVSEYVVEIFEYLREKEKMVMPDPHYMLKQKELRWKMRTILIDWLVEVHQKFKLLAETLFLTVNIIDRFLSLKVVQFSKLQLVGVTAMFIAAKYEEVYAPSINQYVYMTDGGYTNEEIMKAERVILGTLNFDLQYPNPLNFLRRVSKADFYDLNTRTMSKYLMEITLLDECFLGYTPSMIATAAMYISRNVHSSTTWDHNLIHYSGYTEDELKNCVMDIINFLHKGNIGEAVKAKYSTEKNRYVGCTVERWLDRCVDGRSFGMPWL